MRSPMRRANSVISKDGADPIARGMPEGEPTIGTLLRDAHRLYSRSLQTRISAHGVSIGQWYFLRALWDEDGLTQRELSARVGMMEPTTVTALNGMEARGLVERVRNANDRRKVNIFLTEKGQRLKNDLLADEEEVMSVATDNLNPTRLSQLTSALQDVIANLEADR